MKKIFVGLIIVLTSLSCVRNDDILPDSITPSEEQSTFVTPEMALEEVENFLKEISVESRAYTGKKIANIYSTQDISNTRTDDNQEPEPFVYVVNFENEEGYAIVAGDTRVPPILAVVDSGSLEQGEVVDNPGMIMMLSNIETDYRMTLGLPVEDMDGNMVSPIGVAEDGSYVYPAMTNVEITPAPSLGTTYTYGPWDQFYYWGTVLDCEWGQSSTPYNLLTFTDDGYRAHAGCVATAVAQIMYFWGHDCTYNGCNFDWDIMHQYISIYYPYVPANQMIAELMYMLGLPENLDMDYGVSASGAFSSNVPRTFENFGYTSGGSIEAYNYEGLREVIESRPVYVSGYAKKTIERITILGITISTKTTYDEGHAWVIDQVMTRGRNKYTYIEGYKQPGFERDYQTLVHCNFGWDGDKNGYYYSGKFEAYKGPVTRETDTTTTGISYYYQFNLKMNTGIYL